MPLIKIHTQKGKAKQVRQAIMDGVHKALVSAFKIPVTDRTILLTEYPKEHFSGRNENFTIVEITAFAGRSKDAKRQLYKEIVDNISVTTKLKKEDVFIIVNDISKENWGIRGGQMASEVDIGFKVDI
ncbi:MAG TPA: tautomerase family protein [Candidatus Goldiibacteriota bacterium]|nr:tautomerase family protein [Candidatus Goldiibacteriota bacterium]